MTTISLNPPLQQQRKFLLVLPLLILPFLIAGWYGMGGGRGSNNSGAAASQMGFNMELPKAHFDKKEKILDKMDYYKRADADSVRKREYLQQDPYRSQMLRSAVRAGNARGPAKAIQAAVFKPNLSGENPRAEELLKKLEVLKKVVLQGDPAAPHVASARERSETVQLHLPEERTVDLPVQPLNPVVHEPDPQLERLNQMLDKIMRIQGANSNPESPGAKVTAKVNQEVVSGGIDTAVRAVVEGDQELINGATIALRLAEGASIKGTLLPSGQLLYGTALLRNDRLEIRISTIRNNQAIYSTALEIYDMDGLPGIHIPDRLGRQVARESAGQGISSLNMATYDPTIGGQALNAGIQAAKSLFSRKVRQVRVLVKGGYQVLLRNEKGVGAGGLVPVEDKKDADSLERKRIDSIGKVLSDSGEVFLHRVEREGKIRLVLQGVYLRAGLFWLSLSLENRSRIAFIPESFRCSVQDRKRIRRAATQELPLPAVYEQRPSQVLGDSSARMLVGFRPFVPDKGKKLVIFIAEKAGGRYLTLEVPSRLLLDTR